jgi:hypothetical protein
MPMNAQSIGYTAAVLVGVALAVWVVWVSWSTTELPAAVSGSALSGRDKATAPSAPEIRKFDDSVRRPPIVEPPHVDADAPTPWTLEGRLVCDSPLPITRVEIKHRRYDDLADPERRPPLVAMTDDDGSFRLAVDPSHWIEGRLYEVVASEVVASGEPRPSPLFRGTVPLGRTLSLAVLPERRLHGTVRNNGEPLPDAVVRLGIEDSDHWAEAKTSTQGTFQASTRDELSSTCTVRVSSERFRAERRFQIAELVEGVVIDLDVHVVRVRYVDRSGRPWPGARLIGHWTSTDGRSEILIQEFEVAEDGFSVVHLEPGTLELSASAPGALVSVHSISVPASSRSIDLVGDRQDAMSELRGQVFSSRGPVEMARVWVFPLTRSLDQVFAVSNHGETDERGFFAVAPVSEPPFRVVAQHPGESSVLVETIVDDVSSTPRIQMPEIGGVELTVEFHALGGLLTESRAVYGVRRIASRDRTTRGSSIAPSPTRRSRPGPRRATRWCSPAPRRGDTRA